MGFGRLFVIMCALVLSFIGMIFLESKMTEYAALELVIIVVAILLSVIALIGIAAESRWAWPFSTILFALILANSVFQFVTVGAFVTFVLQLVVGIFGLLVTVLSIEDFGPSVVSNAPASEAAPSVEPYTEEPAQVTYSTEKKKRGRRKKKK
jgi:hypothetical protein